MKILFIGDIFGVPGLKALNALLPDLIKKHGVDFVVANGENSAHGFGITVEIAREIFAAGVNAITTGNHVWDKREMLEKIDNFERLIRPANFAPEAPGKSWCVVEARGLKLGVVNLIGRVFMDPMDCPFHAADRVLAQIKPKPDAILVDFHAEATSEKIAMGLHLDGRVSAVVGTHTHVPTADERVLPGGTGYITDVGMSGVLESAIGMDPEKVLNKFITRLPQLNSPAKGRGQINAVLIEVSTGGRCTSIKRVEAIHN